MASSFACTAGTAAPWLPSAFPTVVCMCYACKLKWEKCLVCFFCPNRKSKFIQIYSLSEKDIAFLLSPTLSEFSEIWNHPSHPQYVALIKASKKGWSRSVFNQESGQLSKIHFLRMFSVSEEDQGSVLQIILLQWMTLRFLDRKRRHSYRFSFSFSFLDVEESEITKDSFRDHSVFHTSIRCPQFFFMTFLQ